MPLLLFEFMNNPGKTLVSFFIAWMMTLAPESLAADAATAVELTIDCARTEGTIRPLHGVNGGPMHAGETLDLSAFHRELGVPLTRLHDCHWPNADVVDIHVLFPDFQADPSRPESYDFRRTDDYLQSIVNVGSGIVFRLGESIEHSQRKYHVHPPTDPEKWAAVCRGIIRHYNEGWASGFHHKIRYWEIWNEPENRPAMWTGTDEQFLDLYVAAAKAIKTEFPDVCVGGPAFGFTGRLQGEKIEPSPFVQDFLARCKRDAAPLDFFSWHTYTNNPLELTARAKAVRRLLDEQGFPRTENHLNEWNYLPDNDWSPMLAKDGLVRQRWFERIGGAEGAAFTATALVLMQDAPLDAANFYSADIQGFGLFNTYGVPYKNFHALKAFKMLVDTPLRIAVEGQTPPGVAVGAGMDKLQQSVTILAGNCSSDKVKLRLRLAGLPWSGKTHGEILLLNASHDLRPVRSIDLSGKEGLVECDLNAASVGVVTIGPSDKE